MKRFYTLLALSLLLVSASAVEISKNMRTYIDGCTLFLSAIDNKSLGELADAQDTFSKLRLVDYTSLTPKDEASEKALGKPLYCFTGEYAAELIKKGEITAGIIEAPHAMRDGLEDEYDIQVYNASIAPNAKASFFDFAKDDCEILLYSTKDSNLSLEITLPSGERIEAEKLQGIPARIAYWNMPLGEITITITNNGDKASTFVLAFSK